MTTFGAIAVGFKAARAAKRQSRIRLGTATVRVGVAKFASKIAQAFGSIAALGCLVAAAWTVALPLGLLAAAVSLFVLEWRLAE